MNKLVTDFNGGFPLTLDDIRWNDDAYRLAFNRIIAAFSPNGENFIISGCTYSQTGTVVTVQPGLIYLNGEILQVDLHTFDDDGLAYFIIAKEVSFDPAGNKTFHDSSIHQTYRKNRGIGATNDILDNTMLSLDGNRIIDRIGAMMVGNWIYPTLNSGYTTNPNNPIRYRKNKLGQLEISGGFEWDGSGSIIAFVLPEGYRPNMGLIIGLIVGGTANAPFLINTDGEFYSQDWYIGSYHTINFISNLD